MGRPRTSELWKNYVRQAIEQSPRASDGAIARLLEEMGERWGMIKSDPPPSARTIRRLRKEFLSWPEEKRRPYQQFSWPWAMEVGELPWEAAPKAFELLAYLHQRAFGRPTLRLVKWFWRVSVAAPDAPSSDRLRAARQLAATEALGRTSSANEGFSPATKVEWFLAYAPWRSQVNAKLYALEVQQYDSLKESLRSPTRAEPIAPFNWAEVEAERGTKTDAVLDALGELGFIVDGAARKSTKETLFGGKEETDYDMVTRELDFYWPKEDSSNG